MSIRRYRKDPRTSSEKRADSAVRRLAERGEFLEVDAGLERQAEEHVRRRQQARRETVASLGKELGILRRAHGWTQEQVAGALGTNKSNISRLESGHYGGMTIEYFIAVIEAFRALDDASSRGAGHRGIVRAQRPPNKALHPTRASRALGSRG
ncbi:MAG TPA: helix-turn-helix transcriptional regulator [Polyangiaceae bacterium]